MDHGAMGHGAMGHDMTAPAGDPMALHLRGMWVAFTVGAAFIVYFVTRVKAALADRDVALAKAREAAVASERLASLATLAGGAAHELATPLGTIAIVARELELELAEREVPSALADVQLIRSQVDRCRAVLDQLAVDAGQAPGESEAALPLSELLAESLAPVRRRDSIDLDVSEELGAVQIPGFVSAMAQTLRAVVRNALDASGPEQRVRLTAVRENGGVRVVVRDEGTGMDEATLTRATEPFFTTKEHGRGMGLGLFLGRVVLERQGGSLTIESSLGHGTSVSLWFPTGDPT
jgi:two-component system sensor histidine kinase RegB